MARFVLALLILLATPFSLFSQPAGCTSTTCPGAALPSGYISTSGNQFIDGQGNKVRIAATTFLGNPGDGTMPAIRAAGFNAIRLPWRDLSLTNGGGLFNGCDTLANLTTCINNATAANLKVILYHLGNEVPTGGSASACYGRQQNGLWFDSGGSSNNTDGCETGTVTYAQFKANTVNLLSQFAGNSTVIGYEFHHEPIVVRGSSSGTVQFTINSTGQIIDPNGQVFVARGYSVTYEDVNAGVIPPSLVQSLFPRTNFIRLTNFLQNGYPSSITPGTIANWITQITALGIVVQISDYAQSNPTQCRTGADLTAAGNWYKQWLGPLASNPYIWAASQNECFDPNGQNTFSNQVEANYQAVRSVAPNMIFTIESPGGNPTPGAAGFYNASQIAAMTNVTFGPHMYVCCANSFGGVAQTQAAYDAAEQAFVNAYHSSFSASNEPVIPVIATEQGDGLESGDPLQILADQAAADISSTTGSGLSGFAQWLWNCNCSTPSAWFQMVQGTTLTNPFGLDVQAQIAAAPGTGPTPPTPGGNATNVNWGGGGDTDIYLACSDVGSAVYAVNPGVIEWCPGPINTSSTLLNGQPLTSGSGSMDLSKAGSLQVSGFPSSKIAYSVDIYPTNVKNVSPDSGASAITVWNTFFGYLITGNTSPVTIMETGCSCDGTNGNLTDDQAFMNSFVPYLNGTATGGVTYAGGSQPTSTNWWSWGNNGGNPDGTLNSDKVTLNVGQQTYWSQLLFTSPIVVAPTVWNPSDATSGITLSNNNRTAASVGAVANAVRGTTSKSSGAYCYEVSVTTITPNLDVGFANGTFSLANTSGLGSDVNGIGFDPNSGGGNQGIFFNNNALSTGSVTSANGTALTMCANFNTSLAWFRSTEMAGAGNPWNNSATANPATGVGGVSFSGMTCPCYPIFNDLTGGAKVVINTTGPFAVATPAGFTAWDAAVAGTAGHAQVIVLQ